MTPSELRSIRFSLDDDHGMSGLTRLSRLLGWHHSTVRRKLTGKSQVTKSDALAIRRVAEMAGT